ncbi:MAG: M14-type cytosolic carboxypeptidase, partial [Burkholderiaceae bacterium]
MTTSKQATISISTHFDSGAIDVVSLVDPQDIQLKIRADQGVNGSAEFAQWFHFRLQGAAGVPVTLRFLNAGSCAYPKGWDGYRVVASYDRQLWFRIDTQFDGQVMTAHLTPDTNSIYFAYFEPYSYERHLDLLGSAAESEHVQSEFLGHTVDGRDMNVLHITDASSPVANKKNIWLIARQHPGETMAEWFVEGFLERLLDVDDPVSRVLLAKCVFHVVPNMNP